MYQNVQNQIAHLKQFKKKESWLRLIPSSADLTNTSGLLLMKFHMRSYVWMMDSLKKFCVEPPFCEPYLISVCLLRSSALLMGDCMRWTVRKAVKLAVYEEIMMRVKKAQATAIMRTLAALGAISVPERRNWEVKQLRELIAQNGTWKSLPSLPSLQD